MPGLEGPEGPKGSEGSGGLKGERGLPGDPGRCRPRRSFLQDDPHANLPINAPMFRYVIQISSTTYLLISMYFIVLCLKVSDTFKVLKKKSYSLQESIERANVVCPFFHYRCK